jgi:hypothetical protein
LLLTRSDEANIDSLLQANMYSPQASLKAELEQLHCKDGSLLEEHQEQQQDSNNGWGAR